MISPLTGVTTPEIVLNKVVLPAPFGPTTATNSPRSTSSETPLNARKPPYATSSDLIFSTVHPLLTEIGFDHRWVPDNVSRRAACDHSTVVEHTEMIRKLHHGVHGVLDNHNGHAFAV